MKYELRAENPTFGAKVLGQSDDRQELIDLAFKYNENDKVTLFSVVNLEVEALGVTQ